MKKVLEIIIHKKAWGVTSGDVLTEANCAVQDLNTTFPWEHEPCIPDMDMLARRMKEACDKATARRRKGMMISSRFRVEQPNFYTVMVKHVLNEHEPELFLTFKRRLTAAELSRIEGDNETNDNHDTNPDRPHADPQVPTGKPGEIW